MPWKLIDKGTGKTVGTYKLKSTAIKKRNQKDNDYGGYRFSVQQARTTTEKSKKKKKRTA